MSTRMLKMNLAQRGWVAGVISCFGIFGLSKHSHPEVELAIQSVKHPDMVRKMSSLLGIKVNKKKSGLEVLIRGEELQMLWPFITTDVTEARDVEYWSLMAEAAKRGKAYDDKIAYQKERAAEPRSTPDALRRHAEAMYKNDDPAVQVLDEGFLTSDMAVEYDLDRARHEREKAS